MVDDGSRDGTAALVETFAAPGPARTLAAQPGNRGKGYSVRHGMLEARGDWVLFSDADLSAPIEELSKLMDAARERQAQVAIGSRDLDRSLVGVHQSRWREMAGVVLQFRNAGWSRGCLSQTRSAVSSCTTARRRA